MNEIYWITVLGNLRTAALIIFAMATGVRYKKNINPHNRDADADNFLKNCSYTGLNLGKNK